MADKKLTHAQINKLYKDTFNSPVGQQCLDHLMSVFAERDIARPGDDLLAIGIRQGEASLARKIYKEAHRKDI